MEVPRRASHNNSVITAVHTRARRWRRWNAALRPYTRYPNSSGPVASIVVEGRRFPSKGRQAAALGVSPDRMAIA